MLLTRKTDSAPSSGPRMRRLVGSKISTMDRRTFLKRSGLAAGAGAFASQLPYGVIGPAEAAKEGCPISGALKGNVELSVEATLVS